MVVSTILSDPYSPTIYDRFHASGGRMDIKQVLTDSKHSITDYLDTFFDRKRSEWETINRWGSDALDRLQEFMKEGKMIRGSLVLRMSSISGNYSKNVIHAAAAVEFLQAALLVHDDILDEDDTRCGLSSMHT